MIDELELATEALSPELSKREALPVCLCPWLENSYGLVAWFDMLQFSADAFAWSWRQLRIIRTDVLINCAICLDGDVAFHVARDLNDETRKLVLSSAETLETSFRRIGLTITADTIKELTDELKGGDSHTSEWLSSRIDGIERLATKELRGRLFMYIPEEKAKFWPRKAEPFAFGKEVSNQFPSTTFDANSAAMCLATSQSTAAVFHLMRVLEIGLAVLGSVFGVSLAHTNWGPAIEEIEKKVRKMHEDPVWKALSDCKEQQSFYALAASHFGILKDAGAIMQCMFAGNIPKKRAVKFLRQ